ncbi:MAG TPA: DUF502 domain-containing protein [Gammaproteobacteria bacterium]|nr:DUF502 domain-containing protein [Gammaproteobacteria bacterium]
MVTRLRRYLVAGLLVWVPIGVTILVFRLLLRFTDRFLFWLPAAYRPDQLIGHEIPGLSSILAGILAFVVLLVTGILAANFIGRQLVSWYESLLARIPFVRSVYGAVKNFTEVVFSDTDSSFKRVLLVEWPREGIYSIAFQTSENAREVQAKAGETIVTVFVPTTPNPTSGFIVFLPRSQVTELEMSVEDALKMIVSLGVVVPKWNPPERELARPRAAP